MSVVAGYRRPIWSDFIIDMRSHTLERLESFKSFKLSLQRITKQIGRRKWLYLLV